MKIAFHTEMYPPAVGGVASHVYALAEGLASRGHEITVVAPRCERGQPRRLVSEGLLVECTPGFGESFPGMMAGMLLGLPRTLSAVRAADLLHSQTVVAAPPLHLASRLGKKPHVITVHTARFLRLARSPAMRPILRLFLNSARHVFVVSPDIEAAARELVPDRPVTRLVNGVNTAVFTPLPRHSRGTPLLVCPRRLVRRNGVLFLIRALPEVLSHVKVQVKIIGDGPERTRLEAEACRLGVSDAVRFAGVYPHDQIPRQLAKADVVVIPSLIETTSMAALEAMACGVPVAASRTGGLPEIVSDATGILFDPGNPDDLARRLVELLSAPDLEERGRRARETIERNWNLDHLLDVHEAVYREIIADGR